MSTLSRWRFRVAALAVAGVAMALAACDSPERAEADAEGATGAEATDAELLAYGLGYYLGREVRAGLAADGVEVDQGLLRDGFRDGFNDATSRWSEEEVEEVLVAVHAEMQKRMVARLLREDPGFRAMHDENLERSRAYLAENRQRTGVRELDSGIQYEILETGAGPSPSEEDVVLVDFTASFVDGAEIESGQRHVVDVDDGTVGARLTLTAMNVGDRWRVVVPSELAYGPAGDPPLIGPNEAIVIDVELLEIQ